MDEEHELHGLPLSGAEWVINCMSRGRPALPSPVTRCSSPSNLMRTTVHVIHTSPTNHRASRTHEVEVEKRRVLGMSTGRVMGFKCRRWSGEDDGGKDSAPAALEGKRRSVAGGEGML